MISVIKRRVPAIPRSQYQIARWGRVGVNSESTNVNSNSIPFEYSVSGDLILNNKKLYFNSEYVDDAKIITWDEAVASMHSHNNKGYLDTINQNLSTSSTPTFTGLNVTNQANIWRANITGGLVLNNKTISELNSVSFNPYENDGVMYTNTIRSNSRGVIINCPLNFDYTTIGTDRLYINNSPNYAPLQIYNNQYGAGIRLHGTNVKHNLVFHSANDVRTVFDVNGSWTFGKDIFAKNGGFDNLDVNGSLSCYELVANKVRSTNGLLYVTDSATVKSMSGDKLVVIFEEYNLKTGDYLLMQNFTGKSVIKKLIKLTYQSPLEGDKNQFNYSIVGSNGELIRPQDANSYLLPAVDDYFVKIDSADESRRTGILLSPYNGGYIDFYTGAGDGVNKTVTTSLGNLDHLNKLNIKGHGLATGNTFIYGKYQRVPKNISISGYDNYVKVDLFDCNWVINNQSTTGSAGGVSITFYDEGLIDYDGAQCTLTVISDTVPATLSAYDRATNKWFTIWGGESSVGSSDFACPAKSVAVFNFTYCHSLYKKILDKYGRYSSGWVVSSKQIFDF